MFTLEYLPSDDKAKFSKDVADFYLKKTKKHTDDTHLQTFCLDKAITYMSGEENLKTAAAWITDGKITIEGTEVKLTLTAQ